MSCQMFDIVLLEIRYFCPLSDIQHVQPLLMKVLVANWCGSYQSLSQLLYYYWVVLSFSLCYSLSASRFVINPRRACAVRVIVLGLCVCLSVRLSAAILALQAIYEVAHKRYQRLQSYTNLLKLKGRFSENNCVREICRENKRKSQYA